MKIEKLLIANRGEVALRILEASRELGLSTVAIYSKADKNQPHVKLADESYCIGPKEPAESYLNFPAVMSAAVISNSEAIHPGYGFLSENPQFANVCEEHEIKFIGPSSDILRLAGNKVKAKKIAQDIGVPILPGPVDPVSREEEIKKAANNIEFPLMVKAARGGGGRGIRIIRSKEDMMQTFRTSQEEAKASFDDGSLYIEKYLPNTKHIEVQILADEVGNVADLGERECSVQRRHQKLLEESPSPFLSEETRKNILEDARKLAKRLEYTSLGTVEFLVDDQENHYFIELNARLQVEHPITEQINDINLIKKQIQMARGEKLDEKNFRSPRGHSIECRINAEDPEHGFTPSPGEIEINQLPGGNGIRLDTSLQNNQRILPSYDSLIGKLITYAHHRKDARNKAISSLQRFEVEGVKTTKDFLIDILRNSKFKSGNYDVNLVEEIQTGT